MPIGSGSLVLASRSVPLHVRKRRLGHSHALAPLPTRPLRFPREARALRW